MDTFWQDLRLALRTLRKNPGFAAVALATLALAIGANTVIFSVVNAVALRRLPYPEPHRMVVLWSVKDGEQWQVSPADFRDWRERNRSFSHLSVADPLRLSLTGGEEPEQVMATRVSPEFFGVMGTAPVLGRDFVADDGRSGAEQVVVLTHGLWQRRYGGDSGLLGRTITVDGGAYRVIGVLPEGFRILYLGDPQLFLVRPFSEKELTATERATRKVRVLGRLAPGVGLARAQAEMDGVAAALAREFPEADTGWGVKVLTLLDDYVGTAPTSLYLVLALVGLVLLVACANLVNLVLARVVGRRRDTALRLALGSGRLRLGRQLVTETLVLALAGGGLGVALAFAATRVVQALAPPSVPRLDETRLDLPVLAFTVAVSLAAGLAIGLVPALRLSGRDHLRALAEGGTRTAGGVRHGRLRNLLVAAQTALVVVLLLCGALLVTSFRKLQGVSPGFATENRLTLEVSASPSKYPEIPQIVAYVDRLAEGLRRLPGVRGAGAVTTLPLVPGGFQLQVFIEGRPAPAPSDVLYAGFDLVSPGYFEAMGVPLVAGRAIDGRDVRDAPGVLVVNETLAGRFWPDDDAVGKRLSLVGPEGPWVEVVGVVGDVRHVGLDAEPRPEMFKPYPQMAFPLRTVRFVVWSDAQPEPLATEVRRAVWAVDPDQALVRVKTLDRIAADSLAQKRLTGLFAGLFGLVALVLGAVGVYGVVSYSVSQRTDEVGVRMALGAQKRDLLRWVLAGALTPVAAGVAAGVAGAVAVGRFLAGFLYGVSATDPLVFAGVALLMLAVAAVAAHGPARRATRVDPVVALRV